MDFSYTILIPLIPLALFLVLGLFSKKIPASISGWLGSLGLGTSFVLSLYTAYHYFLNGKLEGVYQTFIYKTTWLQFTDKLHIDLGVLIDPISVMMMVVVTTVSFMVHIYSRGYMHGDDGYTRFFAYLALFSFSMLGLVLATNLFQMYIFWELVGASSFLLIGYYYTKPSAVAAAKKAFIVTRFADLGFLLGILLISYYTGTFDFQDLTSEEGMLITGWGASASFMGLSVFTWGLILIYMGGVGKSAMLPFHIWLPDAMEGPTPVSALIHAATMVVAGVYLVARLFPAYYFVEDGFALQVVAYVGALSSLVAALIAVTQTDIKRVLAFSTMSQIGYMMLALGVSKYEGHEGLGYMASMFHLFTHAMFKALLFLGAGSVIHAVHSNYMKDMGSLRKYMPITHITFLIASLSIAGFPGFSGFFSKDEILVAAFESNKLIYFSSVLVAGLTAFYMFRLYFGIFWGEDKQYKHAPHESPLTMTIPLIFLAFMSIFAGYIPFSQFVTADLTPFTAHLDLPLAAIASTVGIIGILLAYVFYKKPNNLPEKFANAFGLVYKWIYNKLYFDELYIFITKKILFGIVAFSASWFDKKVVDSSMIGIGNVTVSISNKIKGMQSGKLQDYAMAFVGGSVVLAMIVFYILIN
ncbi:NADH-quinone oxidoreductase subunit L [Lutibacter sp.]|uniref:NADH-quinone oxidoreductase subunit L n=1 Tax=Lutibacter sp. TaxID=1925666 RepID=UPI00356609D2